MIIDTEKTLLYIEPDDQASSEPVFDKYTAKVFNALENFQCTGVLSEDGNFRKNAGTRGMHRCNCGKLSSNVDYLLQGNFITNSLAVHYLARHRNKIPKKELEKIDRLLCSENLDFESKQKLISQI